MDVRVFILTHGRRKEKEIVEFTYSQEPELCKTSFFRRDKERRREGEMERRKKIREKKSKEQFVNELIC